MKDNNAGLTALVWGTVGVFFIFAAFWAVILLREARQSLAQQEPATAKIAGVAYDGVPTQERPLDLLGRVPAGSPIQVIILNTREVLEGEELGANEGLVGEEGAFAISVSLEIPEREHSEIQITISGVAASTNPSRITLQRTTTQIHAYAELERQEVEETPTPTPTPTPSPTPTPTPMPTPTRGLSLLEEELPPQVVMGRIRINGKYAPEGTQLEAYWDDDSRHLAGKTTAGDGGRFRIEVKRRTPPPEPGDTVAGETEDPETEDTGENSGSEEPAGDGGAEPTPEPTPEPTAEPGYRPGDLPTTAPREGCPKVGSPLITFIARVPRTMTGAGGQSAVYPLEKRAIAEGVYWRPGEIVAMDLSDQGIEPTDVFADLIRSGLVISAWRINQSLKERRDDPYYEVWYNYTTSGDYGIVSNMQGLYSGQCLLLNMRTGAGEGSSNFQGLQLQGGWNQVALVIGPQTTGKHQEREDLGGPDPSPEP